MQYISKQGETITDVVINATGDLANWDSILSANGFKDWTPNFSEGTVFEIPATSPINNDVVFALSDNKINNEPPFNFLSMVAGLVYLIENGDPLVPVNYLPAEIKSDEIFAYVESGQSIYDIVLNETGSLDNLDLVLEANGMSTWTPSLFIGQKISIPNSAVFYPNITRELKKYPVTNTIDGNVDQQITFIFDLLNDNWILSTGFWNDLALWKDTKNWID